MSLADAELFERSAAVRAEAQTLLAEGGLLACLREFGPTSVVGSFALDLMVRRDLDIYIRLDDDLDILRFFEIGAVIIRQFPVLKASYSNHFIRGLPEFDHGLYWGILIDYTGNPWKLDVWGHGPAHYAEHLAEFEHLQNALANANRTAILRIKDAVQGATPSLDIYNAVITANVQTIEDYYARGASQQQKSG